MKNLSRIKATCGLGAGKELEQLLVNLHQEVPESIVAGRNIVAGMTRGWGLQNGDLASAIEQDPIYQESAQLADGKTVLLESSLMNLFLIMKYGMTHLSGAIVEFGTGRGGAALFMANVARRLGWKDPIYTLDTFEGMPPSHDLLDLHVMGDFNDETGSDCFSNLIKASKETRLDNLIPVKGRFEETVPTLFRKIEQIALVHIDCDIYSSVKYAATAVKPKMNPAGGYLIFDDPLYASCLGAVQALEETFQQKGFRAEQIYPNFVYRFPKLKN